MKTTVILPFLIILWLNYGVAYRILAIVPYTGKSHYYYVQPILQELANRGHNLTVITAFEEKHAKYEQIVLGKDSELKTLNTSSDLYSLRNNGLINTINFAWDTLLSITESAFNSPLMQDFIKNDNSEYDLIIASALYQEAYYMFAHKYKAPIVGICAMAFTQNVADIMGNPLILNYMIHEFSPIGVQMTSTQKVVNIFATVYELFYRQYYLLPQQQDMTEKHFSHLPQPLPKLKDLERNISMILVNSHFSFNIVRPLVPGIVEIGGAHIKKQKQLPEKLLKYLDEAKEGAIFFSLGSNLQCKNMPREKLDVFLRVFGKLKQRVLWKWEDEIIIGKPDNVLIGKWLPQNDILAHPNINLFIYHGGLLSTIEATAWGVPMIGMPMFGDQDLNVEILEKKGYGLKVSYDDITDASLENAIKEIIDNPKYKKNAEKFAKRFNDRPMSALNTTIFWIEYVIRHKGAYYMRSPLLNMSSFEYYTSELGLIFSLFILCAFISIKLLIKCIIYLVKIIRKYYIDFSKKKLSRHNKNK